MRQNVKPATSREAHAALMRAARDAGEAASREARPVPMIVGNAIGLSDRIDPNGPTYYVPGGVCGFAGVIIKDGRSGFARYCRMNGIGYRHYYGGHYVPAHPEWVRGTDLVQSLAIAEAYARGMAGQLRAHGVECFVDSRMD